MNNNKIYFLLLILVSLVILYWITFITKIGLHGDEAWFGLDGIEIMKNGLSKPFGMNNYSGVIQSYINSLIFKYFGIGVLQLRITGVILNSISLLIIVAFLYKKLNRLSALILVLLIGQSVFYLVYAKIAWEVLSFNFLLISSFIITLFFFSNNKFRYLNGCLFLFVNFIGTYNHIFYSSVVLSSFIGFSIWILISKIELKPWIVRAYTLLLLGLVNSVIVYKIMNTFLLKLWDYYDTKIYLLPLLIIIIELAMSNKLIRLLSYLGKKIFTIKSFISINILIILKILILIISFYWFYKFHAKVLLQIFNQDIIFKRIFSYELNIYIKYIFIANSISILLLTVFFIIKDTLKNTQTPFFLILIAYLGIFHFYTTGFSIRYFWIITLLIFLYLSFNIVNIKKSVFNIFSFGLFINLIFAFILLWSINLDNDRKVKALNFEINGNIETSAHFLNFEPILHYMYSNEIGNIETSQYFFIGNVFNFYKKTDNTFLKYQNTMIIDYDYKRLGNGFVVEKK